ncbi:LysR family transcriptional regulator [Aureimonas sp. AU40]|uniref:LysR family transcriptional regulator n=1 Tax=Aureimonas sp. AU40 TaxID=1637747 RepID=UPI000781F45F|nr:LysR family transcriptional regulator [Aureimonas sp. AU40]
MSALRRLVPSMNALLAFESAARCGSFARAAAELSVTPPAVSRMIGRLEDHLGVRLIQRMPTGNTLTESGAILFEGIEKSFRGVEAALREIERRRSDDRSVTLSVSTAFTTHWLMPRFSRFQADLPEIDLRFQLLPGPLGGPVDDVDLGMRFDAFGRDHDVRLLAPEVLLPICTPAYRERLRNGRIPPESEAVINLSSAQPDWSNLVDFNGAFETGHSLAFSDYTIVVQAALLGQGVALGWLSVVAHWLCVGSLVPASTKLRVTGRPCQLVRSRARPLRPAVAAVRDWIAEEVRREISAIDRTYPELELVATMNDLSGRAGATRS